MTISTSKSSYADCYDLFDRALESRQGIRTSVPDPGAGYHLRTRLHYARTLSRREAQEIYTEDHPAYGLSPYDPLRISAPREAEGKWWVYIEPRAIQGEVEELGAAE